MNNFKILLVDDSQNVLSALKRTFRPENYELFFALSATEALDILKKETIDLIISDENMPEVSGTDLLKLVRAKYPSMIRIMLTGLVDFETVKNAINKGEIYKYLNKPWDDFELLLTVKYALRQKALEEENQLLKSNLRNQENILRQLELKYPGISEKKMSKDGSIIIDS